MLKIPSLGLFSRIPLGDFRYRLLILLLPSCVARRILILRRFLGLESIDIRFSLSDNSKSLPDEIVGLSNYRQLFRFAVRSQSVEKRLSFLVTSEGRKGSNVELTSERIIIIMIDVTFDIN